MSPPAPSGTTSISRKQRCAYALHRLRQILYNRAYEYDPASSEAFGLKAAFLVALVFMGKLLFDLNLHILRAENARANSKVVRTDSCSTASPLTLFTLLVTPAVYQRWTPKAKSSSS